MSSLVEVDRERLLDALQRFEQGLANEDNPFHYLTPHLEQQFPAIAVAVSMWIADLMKEGAGEEECYMGAFLQGLAVGYDYATNPPNGGFRKPGFPQ